MDEVLFFARIFALLSQGRSLGERLTSVLYEMREALVLDAAFVRLVAADVDVDFCYGGGDMRLIDSSLFSTFARDWLFADDAWSRYVDQQRHGCLLGACPYELFEMRFAVGDSVAAVLQVVRRCERGSFEAFELENVRLIATYLRVAIYQSLWGLPQDMLPDGAERIRGRFQIGMLTIDDRCEVLARSALVEKLLDGCSCLGMRGQTLEAQSSAARESFAQILHELANCDSGVYRFLGCDSTDDAALIAISRSNDRGIEAQLRGARYNVFLFSTEQEAIDIDAAAEIWRISVAERRILLAMMHYDSAKRVANELNVSVNTVKAQLKSAYRKMGIVSKAMLVRKLYSARNLEALIDVS